MPYITLSEPKYPLTESEKKWLEERARRCAYFCIHCSDGRRDFPCLDWWHSPNNCPLEGAQDFRDAAEFESRMVAKLAFFEDGCTPCSETKRCPFEFLDIIECVPCRLKYARLAVEQEMEQ